MPRHHFLHHVAFRVVRRSPHKRCMSYRDPIGEKTEFSAKNTYVAPYGDSGGSGVTEMSGNIFCVEIDPVSPIFAHRIVDSKFMIFDILGKSIHHQMILGPPDESLDFF